MIGAEAHAIDKAEDRSQFREAMKPRSASKPRKSMLANASDLKEADREQHAAETRRF
jgi:carbamoyl-phosphate synthase large subunit